MTDKVIQFDDVFDLSNDVQFSLLAWGTELCFVQELHSLTASHLMQNIFLNKIACDC